MTMCFSDKTILITGASSGIGQAVAKQFALKGANLVLCARRLERLQILAKEINKLAPSIKIHTVALDVRDATAVFDAISNIPSFFLPIQILVNNAGLAAGLAKLHEAEIMDWEAMIDTNVKGLLYVCRAIIPQMVAENSGHIINIGSIAGHEAYSLGSVYCGTKFAVNAISKALKLDLTGTKLRVTSIDPGMVETEFSLVRFKGDKARADKVYEGLTPLKPDDIADTILYVASRPPHVNISEIIMMPTAQSSATVAARTSSQKEE